MAVDIFETIGIPDSLKDYTILFSDEVESFVYKADHSVPTQYLTRGIFDALLDYTFTGNQDAKNVALGNGSTEQIDMGEKLKPLKVTDEPITPHSQDKYFFPWDSDQNPRREYLTDVQDIHKKEDLNSTDSFSLLQNYPNPFNPTTIINFSIPNDGFYSLKIYNTLGEEVATLINREISMGNYTAKIEAKNLTSGLYIYRLAGNNVKISKKMILLR